MITDLDTRKMVIIDYMFLYINAIYAYFYINMEENIYTYDIQSEGSTYYPYYNETNSEVNRVITENINTEIIKLIKKGILKTYENN